MDADNETLEVRVEGVRRRRRSVGSIAPGYHCGALSYRRAGRLAQPRRSAGLSRARGRTTACVAGDAGRRIRPRRQPGPPAIAGTEADRFRVPPQRASREPVESQLAGLFLLRRDLLTAKEAEQMPPQVQLAVRRYLECGGTLLIHGRKVPAVFSQGGAGRRRRRLLRRTGPCRGQPRRQQEQIGMDRHRLAPAAAATSISRVREPRPSLTICWSPRPRCPCGDVRPACCCSPWASGRPISGCSSRYKRRIWLWWNVPAISLLTCLAVFGYSVVSEGWTRPRQDRQHDAAGRAYPSRDDLRLRFVLLPADASSGPQFGADTDVTLLGRTDCSRTAALLAGAESTPTCGYVDWTSDQHLTSGWVRRPRAGLFPVPQERRPPRAADFVAEEGGRVADRRQRPGGRHRAALLGRRLRAGVRGPRHRRRRGADACGVGRDAVLPAREAAVLHDAIVRLRRRLARHSRPLDRSDKAPARMARARAAYIAYLEEVAVCRGAPGGRASRRTRWRSSTASRGTRRWTLGSSISSGTSARPRRWTTSRFGFSSGNIFGFRGPQRRGQDHDHADPGHAGRPHRGQRLCQRRVAGGRSGEGPPPRGLHARHACPPTAT